MILFYYKANYKPRESLHYYYDGTTLDSLKEVDEYNKIDGWIFKYFDTVYKINMNLILFEKNGMIFIHLNDAIYNLSLKEVEFIMKKTWFTFFVSFYVGNKEVFSIHQSVSLRHHFMHDGCFPEDIFPIHVALLKFKNNEKELVEFFQKNNIS